MIFVIQFKILSKKNTNKFFRKLNNSFTCNDSMSSQSMCSFVRNKQIESQIWKIHAMDFSKSSYSLPFAPKMYHVQVHSHAHNQFIPLLFFNDFSLFSLTKCRIFKLLYFVYIILCLIASNKTTKHHKNIHIRYFQ